MKRTQELINQLKEQFDRQEAPAQMLATAQLLEAELSRLAGQAAANRGSAKVAVMMPSAMKMYAGQPMQESKPVARSNGAAAAREQGEWPFNPLTDIPTLAHQQSAREL